MNPKTQNLLLGIILLISTSSFAQEFDLGLQGGLIYSNTFLENDASFQSGIPEPEYKAGYNLNAFVRYKSKNKWGVTIEPGFIQKGNHNPKYAALFEGYDQHFNYFYLPVLVDFHINNFLILSIGPEVSYLNKAETKSESFTRENTPLFKRNTLSGIIGLECKITRHLNTGIRYSRDFTSIQSINFTDDNGQPLDNELNTYNHYFQVFMKYNIIRQPI